MVDEADNPSRPPALRADKIDPWARWVCGLIGAIGVGAGGVAVFVTDVEVGPAALLIVGVVFLLIGVGGTMPSRLKIGDTEAAWQHEVGEILAQATEAAPPAVRADIVGQLVESVGIPQAVSRPTIDAAEYQKLAREILDDILETLSGELSLAVERQSHLSMFGQRFDYLITRADGGRIPVHIRASSSWGHPFIGMSSLLRSYMYDLVGKTPNLAGYLLVSDDPSIDRKLLGAVPDYVDRRAVQLIQLSSRRDREKLVEAIRTLNEVPIIAPR